MRYRIDRNQHGEFRVCSRYWWWPFWSVVTEIGPFGSLLEPVFYSLGAARDHVVKLQRAEMRRRRSACWTNGVS